MNELNAVSEGAKASGRIEERGPTAVNLFIDTSGAEPSTRVEYVQRIRLEGEEKIQVARREVARVGGLGVPVLGRTKTVSAANFDTYANIGLNCPIILSDEEDLERKEASLLSKLSNLDAEGRLSFAYEHGTISEDV